jgi:hypothetical protein
MKRLFISVGLGLLVLSLAIIPLWTAQAQNTQRIVTVLASAGRIATTNSADFINLGEVSNIRGAYLTLDVTGASASPVITLSIKAKDYVSGAYESVFVAATGVTTIGTHTYLIYPGIGAAANDVAQIQSYPLPLQWRVTVDHADTDPITYSVGALLIP